MATVGRNVSVSSTQYDASNAWGYDSAYGEITACTKQDKNVIYVGTIPFYPVISKSDIKSFHVGGYYIGDYSYL